MDPSVRLSLHTGACDGCRQLVSCHVGLSPATSATLDQSVAIGSDGALWPPTANGDKPWPIFPGNGSSRSSWPAYGLDEHRATNGQQCQRDAMVRPGSESAKNRTVRIALCNPRVPEVGILVIARSGCREFPTFPGNLYTPPVMTMGSCVLPEAGCANRYKEVGSRTTVFPGHADFASPVKYDNKEAEGNLWLRSPPF